MDQMVGTLDLSRRQTIWREIQNIINGQVWNVWLPVLNVKIPIANRFGNVQPSIMSHRIIWNIDRVFVKARES
jgi:ABC-type transport system substrate-binding protein